MDIEFHYDITYILARKSGFSEEDSEIIAYASQYTDDNNKKIIVKLKDDNEYKNYISQTMNILKPINKLVRIYSCFHFFPGDYGSVLARRIDGSLHILNTTPNSKNAKSMFLEALSSKNLYRIGIATHCYADTWAHQNFVGFRHVFSAMNLKNFKNLLPDIGHAEAEHKPDIPSLEWEDGRLVRNNINNKQRFIDAAEAIFEQYCAYNGTEFKQRWKDLKSKLENAIGDTCKDEKECNRRKEHRNASYRLLSSDMPIFQKEKWLKEAVNIKYSLFDKLIKRIPLHELIIEAVYKLVRKKRKIRLKGFARTGFESSHWYKFQEAVKEHQENVMETLKPIYEQMGFDKNHLNYNGI